MQGQQWRQAAQEFEAAAAGDPDSVAYLTASARALQASGSYELALTRATRAAQLEPEDPAQQQLVGELALAAGRYRQAETAFEGLLENDAGNPVAVEGLARALRGDGDAAGAKRQYARLIALMPALHDEPSLLAGALATLETDSVRLAEATPERLDAALARVYFQAGEGAEAVRVLHRYHAGGERPAYADAEYEGLAQGLDEEATAIAKEAEQALRRAGGGGGRDGGARRTGGDPRALRSTGRRGGMDAGVAAAGPGAPVPGAGLQRAERIELRGPAVRVEQGREPPAARGGAAGGESDGAAGGGGKGRGVGGRQRPLDRIHRTGRTGAAPALGVILSEAKDLPGPMIRGRAVIARVGSGARVGPSVGTAPPSG